MAGVGKILKQAQKMQERIENAKTELANAEIRVSHGGGAITIVVNGDGDFKSLTVDPEFLKEDPGTVEQTLLSAIREATAQSKTLNRKLMAGATEGFALPVF